MLSKDLPALTGIRGIAALWIVCLHFEGGMSRLLPAWGQLDFLWNRGHEAIPLFYILSGFILTHVYRAWAFRAADFGAYLRHRIFRIYPLHLATLLLLGALVVASHFAHVPISGTYPASSFVENLFLLQSFPYFAPEGWNYPSWTISVELFAYLFAFPLGCILLRRISSPKGMFLIIFGLVAASLIVQRTPLFAPFEAALVGSLLFLAGMFLAGYAERNHVPRMLLWFGVICAFASPALFYFFSDDICRPAFSLLCPFILLGCLGPSLPLARFLSSSLVIYLGELSYALYMTHAITEKCLKTLLPVELFADSSLFIRLAGFTGYWIAIFAVTIVAYYAVERFARQWLRRRFH